MPTGIQWTDETWNPLCGCSKVSAGCKLCYAEKMAARLRAMALADMAAGRDPGRKRHYIDAVDERGRWTGTVVPVPEALPDPLHWERPRTVFVNSMSDLFHPTVPFQYIAAVFGVMAACRQHKFQALTKHIDRAAEYFAWQDSDEAVDIQQHTVDMLVQQGEDTGCGSAFDPDEWPLPNVWLGCTVENAAEWARRVPDLLRCPAAVRWVSYEPALERIDFGDELRDIDWLVIGGESGCGARPFDVYWAGQAIKACREHGCAPFVKQLGSRPFVGLADMPGVQFPGEPAPLRGEWPVALDMIDHPLTPPVKAWRPKLKHPKGGNWDEWPEWLRVREYPEAKAA